MKKKQVLSAMLATSLMCGGVAAGAVNDKPVVANEEDSAVIDLLIDESVVNPAASVLFFGTVQAVENDESGKPARVLVKSESNGTMYMALGDQTCYIDATAGTAANPADLLKEGATLYVYHSQAATFSIPSQAAALVVVGNVAADASSPQYHLVEKVSRGEDGKLVIESEDGQLYLTAAEDTVVLPYLTRNRLDLSAIEAGSRIVAWYDTMTLSSPAQAYTSKVMVLPSWKDIMLESEWHEIETRKVNGVTMVPVRAVADGLGLKVSYEMKSDGSEQISVENESFAANVIIGKDSVIGTTKLQDAVGKTAPQSYGAAAFLEKPGTTWVPAKMFEVLGYQVFEGSGGLMITTATISE